MTKGWRSAKLILTVAIAYLVTGPTFAQTPLGASVLPPEGWQFPCAKPQEATLEIWDSRVQLERSSVYGVRPAGNGVCKISFRPRLPDNKALKDPRLFFPVLPTDTALRWRANLLGEGKQTPFYAFELEKLADYSFGSRPRGMETTDATWTVTGGYLENQSNPPSSFAIFRLSAMNLTHPPRYAQGEIHPLTHFKVDSYCASPPCELGLVGILKGGVAAGDPPEQWWELKITNNASAQVVRYRYDRGSGRLVTAPVGRAIPWDASAGPVDVKIGVLSHHLRIQVAGKTVLCDNNFNSDWADYYYRLDRPNPKVGVGVRWRSSDDDEGTNFVRIDQIRVQSMPNGDLLCRRPLPD